MRRVMLAIAIASCAAPPHRTPVATRSVPPPAATADAGLDAAPPLSTRRPRPLPDVVRWTELGPPETIRPAPKTPLASHLLPVQGDAPEPHGVVTLTDRLELWTPSHPAPVASRELGELGKGVALLASAHGLVVVANENEVLALDAETLATRWRHRLAPDERFLDSPRQVAITRDVVVLDVVVRANDGPFERRLVALDHAGTVRFTTPNHHGYPMAVADGVLLGGTARESIARIDAAGAVRWQKELDGPYTSVGRNLLVHPRLGGGWTLISGATGAEISRLAPPVFHGSPAVFVPGIADANGVVFGTVEGKARDGVGDVAVAAWDTTTGKVLWTTRERASFGLLASDWQLTRGEVLYTDHENGEIVAIDRATHTEKWSWPMPAPTNGHFVFANDGEAALYAESSVADGLATVVFRPGTAPPVMAVKVRGRTTFDGRPVGGVAVRAGNAFTRSDREVHFTLDVHTRLPLRIDAKALGVGRRRSCRAWAYASAEVFEMEPKPADLALVSPCDAVSDE